MRLLCVCGDAIRALRAMARRRLAARIDSPAIAALRFLYTNHFEFQTNVTFYDVFFSWQVNYCDVTAMAAWWSRKVRQYSHLLDSDIQIVIARVFPDRMGSEIRLAGRASLYKVYIINSLFTSVH